MLDFPKCLIYSNKKPSQSCSLSRRSKIPLHNGRQHIWTAWFFEKKQVAVPIRVKCKFDSIGTFNQISFGLIENNENNMSVIKASGLFEIEDQPDENVQIAKLIEEPKIVLCSSFNDFVERFTKTLSYFWVDKTKSPTLKWKNEHEPIPFLIDETELSIVHYVYGNEKKKVEDEENKDDSNEEDEDQGGRRLSLYEKVDSLPNTFVKKSKKGIRVVHVNQKFVMFDGCSMAGDVTLSDTKQGSFLNPLDEMKKDKKKKKAESDEETKKKDESD